MSAIGPHIFRGEIAETDDSKGSQTLRVLGVQGEELTGVHRIQYFGDSGHAPKGSHAVMLDMFGDRERVVALGVENEALRPKGLSSGQRVIYDGGGNASRYLGADGIWHDAGERPQKVTGKTIEITGTDKVTVKVGDMVVVVTKDRIDLGADPAPHQVVTLAGPSTKVFAVI